MLDRISLHHILFLDVETVPQAEQFDHLPESDQTLYEEKTRYIRKEDYTAADYYDRAGIWAEFGKIACISVGYFVDREPLEFRTRTFAGEEPELLEHFKELVEKYFSEKHHLFCAHNGKEFDFPYIARRMVINGIKLPEQLNYYGKKPWEIKHLDTLELWKFGDRKNFTSLKLLTRILGIPSPKNDIDGSQVRDVYYNDRDIERISCYCEADVLALAQVVLKFKNLPLLSDEQVYNK